MEEEVFKFNEDKVNETITELEKEYNKLVDAFTNIATIQDNFKNNHGGTYFENRFLPRSVMETYKNELRANIDWLKKHRDEVVETNRQVAAGSTGLGSHAPNQSTSMSSSESTAPASTDGVPKTTPGQTDNFNTDDDDTPPTAGGGDSTVPTPSRVKGNSNQLTTKDYLSKKDNTNATPANILNAAKIYQEKLFKDGDWKWVSGSRKNDGTWLYYNNIEKTMNHDKHWTECASYVATILYMANIFTESELNNKGVVGAENVTGWGYNSPNGIKELCEWSGWTKITNVKDVQPGDILFYKNSDGALCHVDIYAGNGLKYSGGDTKYFKNSGPTDPFNPASVAFAYRAPNK